MRLKLVIKFEKWHGNGNDFVIINSIEDKFKLKKNFIKKISDRNKGVGFDQLIHVALPTKHEYDFFIKFYNSDGSEAGMCLNGIRCASSYIWGKQLSPIKKMSLQTKHVNLECSPEKSNKVSINIDKPREIRDKELHRNLKKVIEEEFFLLNIGNNHLCIKMKSIEKVDLKMVYKNLEKLIKKLNINLSIFSETSKYINIRTYENGVGETLSCGSASLCVASNALLKKNTVKIASIGGELKFKNHGNGILMSGLTSFIYEGNINE